jgi:hypothetical protein
MHWLHGIGAWRDETSGRMAWHSLFSLSTVLAIQLSQHDSY